MKSIAILLKPRGYNDPAGFKMLWNQWLHWGYGHRWWSYKFYSSHAFRRGVL